MAISQTVVQVVKRFTAHRAVTGNYFVYDNVERREVNQFDTRRDARDVARWENSQIAARRNDAVARAKGRKRMAETSGTAYQRMLQLQAELDKWANPLGDLNMLRHAVAELIDINLQMMHERDEWRGPKLQRGARGADE